MFTSSTVPPPPKGQRSVPRSYGTSSVFPALVPHSEADSAASEVIQTYWTNFAKTCDPKLGKLPPWGWFMADKGNYLHFASAKEEPVVAYDLGGKSCMILSGTAFPGGAQ